jgi:hypothetical protein
LFLTIGPPTAAVPVSTRVSGFNASADSPELATTVSTDGQFAAMVVHWKKNGNALKALRRNR